MVSRSVEYPYTAEAFEGLTKEVNNIILNHSQGVISVDNIIQKLHVTLSEPRKQVCDAVLGLGYYREGKYVYRSHKGVKLASTVRVRA